MAAVSGVRKLNDRVMKLIQKCCCFVTTSSGYKVTFLLQSRLISLCVMSPEEWNAWERHSNIIRTLILGIWRSLTDILSPFRFMFQIYGPIYIHAHIYIYICVCARVRARARARVCVCVKVLDGILQRHKHIFFTFMWPGIVKNPYNKTN
jgi:hypothetical protein